MRFRTLAATAAAVFSWLAIPAEAAAEADILGTRTALEQWLDLRKLISEEQNDWREEKETIRASIDLIHGELARLDEELETLADGARATDAMHETLRDENTALQEATAAISGVLGELETRITELHEMLPAELQAQLKPLFVRLPEPDAPSRAGIGERLQNVIGMLGEIEKFNRTITIVREMQQLPSGETAQVRTMYLGLGAAWFTNEEGTYGGSLTPARGGWTINVQPELASRIRAAIAIYENDAQARFVPLPVEIQ
jgi:hypothetical protein